MEEKQMLLLVDEKDNFLGKYAEKEKCHLRQGLHHRAFVVLLENKKGEVLLQKRKHKLWDGYWDLSAISHVLHYSTHDETYEEAAARSLKREMGISAVSLKKVGAFNYFAKYGKNCENEYCAILLGEYDGKINPNKDVVYEYAWVKREEFIKDVLKQREKKYTPWVIYTMTNLFLPKHVAMIMDGNRRWARERKLPVFIGHRYGFNRIEPTVSHAADLGIKYLTFWAFSTENWNREKREVDALMNLFRRMFSGSLVAKLKKNNVRVKTLGDISAFPKDIEKDIQEVVEDTKNNTGITVNFALNYGGREEILRAVQKIIAEKPKEVTERIFSDFLYTAGQPDPDLIIRTGGEQRLSGYLPWQSTYSELYFTNTYWPDFNEKEFDKAILDYISRERRFGK
ncbi:di-trans,poly-cis-decaprenylcistransferase [Candidatus Shapirobacteria bacterium]|nr:di-trans,poly-cis-decaprenylcistransferase [Candidatus Shapirobacteria bacterium]